MRLVWRAERQSMVTRKRSIRPGGLGPPCGSGPLRGFTLIELLIVIALVLILSTLAIPVFTGEMKQRRIDDSISQMRSLIQMTRAHAMNDGKRYRIRWADESAYKEAEEKETTLQPIVEVEEDPLGQPGVFTPVKGLWAYGETLREGMQCLKVVLGRPEPNEPNELEDEMRQIANGISQMFDEESETEEMFEEDMTNAGTEEEKDLVRPAVVFETDGTAEWATIYLTDGTENEDGEFQTWEISIDGRTGAVGWRRTPTESEREEIAAEYEANKEEHKIVRGREIGAR